jgi:hypothetical protein
MQICKQLVKEFNQLIYLFRPELLFIFWLIFLLLLVFFVVYQLLMFIKLLFANFQKGSGEIYENGEKSSG